MLLGENKKGYSPVELYMRKMLCSTEENTEVTLLETPTLYVHPLAILSETSTIYRHVGHSHETAAN